MTGRRFHELVDDLTALAEIAADLGLTVAQVRMVARKLGNLPLPQQARLCGWPEPSRTSAPAVNRRAG